MKAGTVNDVAKDVAEKLMEDFGRQKGERQLYYKGAQEDPGEMEKMGILLRGVDREVVETMDRTNYGSGRMTLIHLLTQGLRTALADGWVGQYDLHRCYRYPLRDPEADKGRGELRHIQRGRGQSHCSRP